MDEVPFCANVKSWIDAICAASPDLPFAGADIEVRKAGRSKRRDLALRPRLNPRGYALTGEVKLPDTPDGRTPYSEGLVLDAHWKANEVGAEYFFTWNINKLVLWETFRRDTPITQRSLDFFDWNVIRSSDELERSDVQTNLKQKLGDFLKYFAPIYEGAQPFPRKPLDQWFIHLLESALDYPTAATLAELTRRYDRTPAFKSRLNEWVKTNLGATISEEEESDNLERAAKFSCYVLTNKILFYDALRRKYPRRLRALTIPRTVANGSELKRRLDEAFRQAEMVTDDYETVFEGDDFGDRLPFLSDEAVDAWRHLIVEVDTYDLTALDYDIIGQIFDGLISPRERHRFGQHYTKSEIVDIINAFTFRSHQACVLDPACGGGTFLVRAYARQKWLSERTDQTQTHKERLSQIHGVDISAYATHLSTISLATRDLVQAGNYPRVTVCDFFDIDREKNQFPAGITRASGEVVFEKVPLPDLDAVVGNPPYIRQELLSREQKARYRQLCDKAFPNLKLSGRSDIHVYFWPFATLFLRANGWLGLLTSSSWLDVEYGFPLQRWILENFCIVAILESSVEPWFTDARVATAVTILRREADLQIRANNLVHFVQIRRPLADILTDFERAGDRLEAAERVRDVIETRTADQEDQNWRIRVIRQAELIRRLTLDEGQEPGESGQIVAGEVRRILDPASAHSGDKWGRYLRAPDIFFQLLKRCSDQFVALCEIADVRYGLKSGCDGFFFPRDITDDRLEELGKDEFYEKYGLKKSDIRKLRLCKAGDGSVHLIEAEFLEPEVHSLMEINSLIINSDSLERVALIVNQPRSKLRGKNVLKYIEWGERQDFHKLETCAARETGNRAWYQIEPDTRSIAIIPMIQQYRHIIPINDNGFLVNHSLLELCGSGVPIKLLAAVLNSTIVGLIKWSYGRGLGREANLQLDVYAAKMMLVPDASQATEDQAKLLEHCFDELAKLPRKNLAEELEWPERQQLDSAVFSLLGVHSSIERDRLQSSLYSAVRNLHAELRALELKAQADRLKAARRGKATPQSIAGEIWEGIKGDASFSLVPFPGGFVSINRSSERLDIPEGKVRYRNDLFEAHSVIVGRTRFKLEHELRAKLLMAIVEEGFIGSISIPRSPAVCEDALKEWTDYRKELDARFQDLVSQRTTDLREQEKILASLWRRYRRWSETGE